MENINNYKPCAVIDLLQVAYGNEEIKKELNEQNPHLNDKLIIRCGKCACQLLVDNDGVILEGEEYCHLIKTNQLTLPNKLKKL